MSITRKQHIYIDVTGMLQAKFISGIQRVVRSVILAMDDDATGRLVLIEYSGIRDVYRVLDTPSFIEFLKGNGKYVYLEETFTPHDILAGDVFYDIDSVWNLPYKRSVLLPELKAAGAKIAVFIHDIIPVTHPQYCFESTIYNFMIYIGAHLQYADVLVSSAKSTLEEAWKLQDKLGMKRTPGFATGLGSDFEKSNEVADVPKAVKEAATGKYLLIVGTIEPRKNHTYLLKAFEQGLYEKGVKLIFAGRIGWDVADFVKQIKENEHIGKDFFHFEGLDDGAIDYLYQHALAMVFPTFQEGFGLPIVESMQRGTPVFASDIPVMREVGGEYCRYFDNTDPTSLVKVVSEYLEDTEKYDKWKASLSTYVAPTWKDTSAKMVAALDSTRGEKRLPKHGIKQMVMLTARADAIGPTLKYIDAFMPFIQEVVLCCPDKVVEEMKSCYQGRMNIKTLTDSEVLKGRPLPPDHGRRNFMLRCLAMETDVFDEVFLMGDDDYRPLREIDESQYITEDYYRAYYFYNLDQWKGSIFHITSFDLQQFRARDFLQEHHYPQKQYSAHMPQVIERQLYRDMIAEHPGIEEMGLCEWDSYFNYVQYKYPELIHSEPYVSMTWPALTTDWKKQIYPADYVFENFYDRLYAEPYFFDGFSMEFTDKETALREAAEKIKIVKAQNEKSKEDQTAFQKFADDLQKKECELALISVSARGEEIVLGVPSRMELPYDSLVHVPFYCEIDRGGIKIMYRITDGADKTLIKSVPLELLTENYEKQGGHSDFPITTKYVKPVPKGEYKLIIEAIDGNKVYDKTIPLKIN